MDDAACLSDQFGVPSGLQTAVPTISPKPVKEKVPYRALITTMYQNLLQPAMIHTLHIRAATAGRFSSARFYLLTHAYVWVSSAHYDDVTLPLNVAISAILGLIYNAFTISFGVQVHP